MDGRRRHEVRGVTLLEVLFAMGVVVIGILGVAMLVPVAMHHIRRGNIAERSTLLATSGLSDCTTMEILNPRRWVTPTRAKIYDPGNFPRAPYTATSLTPNEFNLKFNAPGALSQDRARFAHVTVNGAFCIDPGFVSQNGSLVSGGFNSNLFPYFDGSATQARMNRIAISEDVDSYLGPAQVARAISPAKTRRLFELHDEIVFDLPSDNVQSPIAKWTGPYPGQDNKWGLANVDDDGNGTADDPSEALFPGSDDFVGQRVVEGNYSWIATLVPKFDLVSAPHRDFYELSIVVFHQRDPVHRMFIDANGNRAFDAGETVTGNERIADVSSFPGAGIKGGEVLVQAKSASNSPVADLDARSGNWVLLSRNHFSPALDRLASEFSWYRVVSADDIDASVTPPQRLITLDGPDWQLPTTGVAATVTTEISFISNVVAVHRQSIILSH